MKIKNLFILAALATLFFTGCVKQKDCDCGLEGTFTYHPSTKTGGFYIGDELYYAIEGKVPKKFQSTTPINVNVCIRSTKSTMEMPNRGEFTCIEMIE